MNGGGLPVKHVAMVRDVARSMNLLDEHERLISLDSLSMLDFVVELERTASIKIPHDSLRPQTFSSLESVAQLIAELRS